MYPLFNLAQRIGIRKNTLIDALTPQSFYCDKSQNKGNSRFVFAGMFVFKGLVAGILNKYYAGSGTQLQHILGNLFRNQYLHSLFDQWKLNKWVRASDSFNVLQNKHIFVYAVLGCVAELSETEQNSFIFRYFINNNNEHIFKHAAKNHNVLHQANCLAKIIYGNSLICQHSLTQDNLHRAIITVKEGFVVADISSKSYHYTRKKAFKLALQVLSEINMKNFIDTFDYLDRIRKRIDQQNELRKQTIHQKIAEKQQLKKEREQKLKKIKAAKDAIRRKAQAEAKKRRAERAARLAEKQAKEAKPLSVKKRRYLEDKKK